MDSRHSNTPPGRCVQVPAKNVNGKRLAKALKSGTAPGFAAWLAIQLQTGGVWLHHLSDKQARQLTGAKRSDVAAERRKHKPTNGNGKRTRRVLYKRTLADADFDAVVSTIGAERLWKAIDRHTQPQMLG
jgi:hypothetical protein